MKSLYLRVNGGYAGSDIRLKSGDIKAVAKLLATLIECAEIPEVVYNPEQRYTPRESFVMELYYEDKEKNRELELVALERAKEEE